MRYWGWVTVAFALSACESPVQSHKNRMEQELKTVSYENGISVTEAQIIGDSYIAVYGTQLRGAPHVKVHPRDGKWIGDVYEGVAVSPMPADVPPIKIDMQTGQVTWANGPTVDRIDFNASAGAATSE